MITPTQDFVLLSELKTSETTSGGVYLPEDAREKSSRGFVLAVGPGSRVANGSLATLEVQEGDTVLFSQYAGMRIDWEGEEFILLREQDIFARFTE